MSPRKDQAKRIAGRVNKRKLQIAENMIPPMIRMKLRKAFTVKGMEFFNFYILLRKIQMGLVEKPDNLVRQFRRSTNRLAQARSPIDGRNPSPIVVNHIAEAFPEIKRFLSQVQGDSATILTWKRINQALVPLYIDVARDKQVYMKGRRYGKSRWINFRKLTPKQERIEKLADEDPEAYSLMKRKKETIQEIEEGIKARIERAGFTHKTIRLRSRGNRPVQVGVDDLGNEWVYDLDGDVLTFEEFLEKIDEQAEAKKQLARVPGRTQVPLKDLRRLPDDYIDKLQGDTEYVSLTDDGAKQGRLSRVLPVKIHFVKAFDPQSGELIKRGYQVVSGGRYKGIYLDDLVNSEGRVIEGTAYSYGERDGVSRKVPVKIDPSEREPYVTKATMVTKRGQRTLKEDKLFIKVSGTKEFKEIRDVLKGLASNHAPLKGSIPSVVWASQANLENQLHQLIKAAKAAKDGRALRSAKSALSKIQGGAEVPMSQKKILRALFKTHKVQGSRESSFYFDPKDFAAIRDRLQGMSLSKGAMEQLQDYFKEISLAEAATVEENLGYYSAQEIGGFIQGKIDPKTDEYKSFDLSTKQKQALAWLDANGNRGVCGLDTGMGKTLLSISMMQKLVRDGMMEEGTSYTDGEGKEVKTNGRFLFVCPKALKGNIRKEVRQFMSGEAQGDMLDRLDVLTYSEFSGSSKSHKIPRAVRSAEFWKNRTKWDARLYVAVFFDEAHQMSDHNRSASKAAQKLWHPRKILLTASPLENDPMQTYTLAAIANNKKLYGSRSDMAAASNIAERRRFRERFCEVLGGRIMGLKEDPEDPGLQQNLMTWTKRNVFYADKTDAADLTDLHQETHGAEMDPKVEMLYRTMTRVFSRTMGGLLSKFRDKGGVGPDGKINPDARDPNLERVFGREFGEIIKLLNGLSNYPGDAFTEIARMMEEGTTLTSTGEPRPIVGQSTLGRILADLRRRVDPATLRDVSATLGNPKLESASSVVRDKITATDDTSRSLLFADDKKLCILSGEQMSSDIPGTHVVALPNEIRLYEGGSPMTEYQIPLPNELIWKLVKDEDEIRRIQAETGGITVHRLPFEKRSSKGARGLRRHPSLPAHPKYNTNYKVDDWQTFVFREIVAPDAGIKTGTLHGKTYETGQNLQAFSQVVHLDRDTWNSESMKQRTARAWRTGQKNPVDEITIDSTYADAPEGVPVDPNDETMDEVRKYYQDVEGKLFDNIIKDAQGTVLGVEWEETTRKGGKDFRVNQEVLELTMSPYVSRSRPTNTADYRQKIDRDLALLESYPMLRETPALQQIQDQVQQGTPMTVDQRETLMQFMRRG